MFTSNYFARSTFFPALNILLINLERLPVLQHENHHVFLGEIQSPGKESSVLVPFSIKKLIYLTTIFATAQPGL